MEEEGNVEVRMKAMISKKCEGGREGGREGGGSGWGGEGGGRKGEK